MSTAVGLLWLAWLGLWAGLARDVKPDRWREPPRSRLAYVVPLALAILLLIAPGRLSGALGWRFLPPHQAIAIAGLLMVIAGFGFAVWARVAIGRNWSSTVTLKNGHTLIRTGPYRHVRHPIYGGLLAALLGTALVFGEWRALAAVALAAGAFVYKSRVEERCLQQVFPEYETYRRETRALIPFLL